MQEHTPWTSGSFDYRNALAREPVPSAQDDRTKSKPKKNVSLGHQQQRCHPEEAQALATRGLANEGSMQFSTLAGRQMQKGAPHLALFEMWARPGQRPDPESNRVVRIFLSAAVAVSVGFRAYRRSVIPRVCHPERSVIVRRTLTRSRGTPASARTRQRTGREFSPRTSRRRPVQNPSNEVTSVMLGTMASIRQDRADIPGRRPRPLCPLRTLRHRRRSRRRCTLTSRFSPEPPC